MKIFLQNFKKIAFRLIIIFFASTIFTVILYRFVPPPVTPLMIIRVAEQIKDGEKIKLKKNWKSLENISPNLVQAVTASEDNKFIEHYGFDFDAIEKAQQYNERKKGKKVMGASTISQQTAKNVFLWSGRYWIRKGFEVYFTLLIELVWGKERIMEVYLNVIETGDGIYGAEAASQSYFHKSAKNLSMSQSALIAAILPNPRKRNPDHPSAYLLMRQRQILWVMERIEKVEFK